MPLLKSFVDYFDALNLRPCIPFAPSVSCALAVIEYMYCYYPKFGAYLPLPPPPRHSKSWVLGVTPKLSKTAVYTSMYYFAQVEACSQAVMQSCSHAVMQSCSHAVMQSCSHAVMQSCSHAVRQSCSHAVMQSGSHAVRQSCSQAVMQSCSHAVMQSGNEAGGGGRGGIYSQFYGNCIWGILSSSSA